MVDLVKGLNPQQSEAVIHEGSPLLILAGAGSGKTKVLTHRIAHFVHNKKIPSTGILSVTFTNKAAREMRERIEKLIGTGAEIPFLGTFHSISVRILKTDGHLIGLEPTFSIYDSSDQKDLVKEAMKKLNMDPKELNPAAVHSTISSAKNDMIDCDAYQHLVSDFFTDQVAKIYPLYQGLLEDRNAVDFDDLIMKTILLLKQNEKVRQKYIDRFQQILVDEYQDTNTAQYSLIKMLAKDKQNISVVGDEDQSIYGWRGANIQNILSFEKDFQNAKIIKLEQNYRSTQIILDAAHEVIHKNTERRDKKLWSEKKTGPKITVFEAQNEVEEAMFITKTIKKMLGGEVTKNPRLSEFAVLYRANAQSRAIEEQFLKSKISYRLVGGQRFYDRKEIKDVMSYLRLFYNPSDSLSLLRVINTPPRGIGPKTITELVATSEKTKLPIVDVITNVALVEDFKDEVEKYLDARSANDNAVDSALFGKQQKAIEADEFIEALGNFVLSLGDTKLTGNKPLINFGRKINELRDYAAGGMNLTEFMKCILEHMAYYNHINDNSKEGESRVENIQELLGVAAKYDTLPLDQGLAKFLEDVSLIEDMQEREDRDGAKKAVTIMTMHASKGLEFETVFVAGMEEGIFPHSRSLADNKEMEEERRLAYVAITRAKVTLYLLYAVTRTFFGNTQSNIVSRFIADIPEHLSEFKSSAQGDFEYDEDDIRNARRRGRDEEFDVSGWEEPQFIDVGDMVMHGQFGQGKVVDIEQEMITIDFIDKGPTKLMAQFAKLKKI
jgi:DNA helicase-2/ATP-dependent DNA helicase PcrA